MNYHAEMAIAIVLAWTALLYAGYAGYRSWRPWYTLGATVLLGLLAGVASLLWMQEPQGSPIFIPLAAFGTSAVAKMLSSKKTKATHRAGQLTLGTLLCAVILFAWAYLTWCYRGHP